MRVSCSAQMQMFWRLSERSPITTYNGHGVAKPGTVKGDHAIVYCDSAKKTPMPRPGELPRSGERGMKEAIKLQGDDPRDTLDVMSRIDYSRAYTVEANVKAMSFGWVHQDSMLCLERSFRDVQSKGNTAGYR